MANDTNPAPDAEAPSQTALKKKFPTPQYVITIFSQAVVTLDKTEADERQEQVWDANLAANQAEVSKKKNKIRVKMRSLLVKMVNRLIREEICPSEAVSIMAFGEFITVRLLVSSLAVPVIMFRCERIGVGNIVGNVFVSPLETSLLPPATKTMIDLNRLPEIRTRSVAAADDNQTTSVDGKTERTALTGEDNEGDEEVDEEVSDSDDDEKDDDEPSVPSAVAIPFLSAEQKRKLQKKIVQARLEWKNTSSKVRVQQVVEEVTAGASFTLDYALFVLCAALIAGAGLATDSGTTVIASMLVSPIMGPVMAMTFGTTVRSKKLVVKGFVNELLSLGICLVVGAIWTLLAVIPGNGWGIAKNWPSNEMMSRGSESGLVSGILIAIPSGVAVALSTLGKNSSGMVGAAISLSLLPPAVNASMCWVYAALLESRGINRAEGDDSDYTVIGGVSFALTLVNVACIWISGTATFWLKEVVPLKEKNAFWSEDIANYRENKKKEADIEVINEGIAAAIELRNSVAKGADGLYKGAQEFDFTEGAAADARRQGLADNHMEDAFYVDDKALNKTPIVPGGAIALDEAELQDAAEDTARKEMLLNNANKFGTLRDAGKALFDNELLAEPAIDSNVETDVGIRHGAVAEDLLLHG